jgi:hypothetical protein
MGLSRDTLTRIAVRTGYPVRAAWVPGHGTMGTVVGTVMHHTATARTAAGDYPSLTVVTKGRSDLPGPLCNFGLGRSGTIYLVTEGIAYHAGVGAWKGITDGNGHFLGIEAEHSGLASEAWPAAESDAYRRLVASILYELKRDTNWDIRHATWALPSGRKTDFIEQPSLTGVGSMAQFDGAVKAMLANPATINKNYNKPAPPPPPVLWQPIDGKMPWLKAGYRDPIPGGGNYVHRLQSLLVLFGYRLTVDGVWGSATSAAVKDFYKKQLGRDVSGQNFDDAGWHRLLGMR